MNQLPPIDPSEISEVEWKQTPLRVRQLLSTGQKLKNVKELISKQFQV